MEALLEAVQQEATSTPSPSQLVAPAAAREDEPLASDGRREPDESNRADPAPSTARDLAQRFSILRPKLLCNVRKTRARMEKQSRKGGEDRMYEVDAIVGLALPTAVRAALQPRFLNCRVVEVVKRGPKVPNRLRCNAGVLDHVYPASELQTRGPREAAQLTFAAAAPWRDAPIVPVATASARASNAVHIRCACRGGCKPSSKCVCRAAGTQCTRRCHCKALARGCTNCH